MNPGTGRIYRPAAGWIAFWLLLGLGLSVVCGLMIWLVAKANHPGSSAFIVVAAAAGIGTLAGFGMWSGLRPRIVLFPGQIEVRGPGGVIILSREQLAGWRGGSHELMLVPRDRKQRPVKIDSTLRLDDEFFEWLDTFPDLTPNEHHATPVIQPYDAVGAKWQRVARHVNWASLALAAWGVLYPRPYQLVTAALLVIPPVALLLIARSRGNLHLDQERGMRPKPNLAIAILCSIGALAIHSVGGLYLLHWTRAALLIATLALASGCVAAKIDPAFAAMRGGWFALPFVSLLYAYGALIQANVIFDSSPISIYSATIAGKQIIHGRDTSYRVSVEPWALRPDGGSFNIPFASFQAVSPGDSVIFYARGGALHIPWYAVQSFRAKDR